MEKSQQDSTWDDRWMGCIFNRAHYISGNVFLREEGQHCFSIPSLLCCYQLLSETGQDKVRRTLALTDWWPIILCSAALKWVAKPVPVPFVTILLCPLGSD